jgi:hypothetical protein
MADDELGNEEGELPIEEFVAIGNARDRGEDVEPPDAKTPAATPEKPAAEKAVDTKPAEDRRSPARRKGSIQQEIDALTTTKHQTRKEVEETQAELTRLRAELAQIKTPAPPPNGNGAPAPRAAAAPPQMPPPFVPPHDPEPKLEDFAKEQDPYTAFVRATTRWEARQEHARLQSAQRTQAMYVTRTSKLSEKLTSYETAHPGFTASLHPEVVGVRFSTPREIGTPLGDLIVDSPHTAALLDHFSKNFADFQRLSTLHPILVARELGRLESRFDAASSGPALKPPPISHAKPPNKPVGSSPVVSDDAEDEASLPIEEFVRKGNLRDARSSARR